VPSIHLTQLRDDHASDASRAHQPSELRHGSAAAVPLQLPLHLIDPARPIDSVMTVRERNGDLLVTDGPFAETKEQMLG
jgi:hypothetical protein